MRPSNGLFTHKQREVEVLGLTGAFQAIHAEDGPPLGLSPRDFTKSAALEHACREFGIPLRKRVLVIGDGTEDVGLAREGYRTVGLVKPEAEREKLLAAGAEALVSPDFQNPEALLDWIGVQPGPCCAG